MCVFVYPYVCKHSAPTLCDPVDCSMPGLCPWSFPGKNTGVDCHFLLQGFFPTRDQTHNSCVSHIGSWFLYYCANIYVHINPYIYIYREREIDRYSVCIAQYVRFWNVSFHLKHYFKLPVICYMGLPKWLSGKKKFACQCRKCGFDPWGKKIPWRRKEIIAILKYTEGNVLI